MMNECSLPALLDDSIKLFSLPDIYFQVTEMINDPRFSTTDLGKVISKDPSLSVRLLKIVNSSFYGFQSKIDTISRAITIVGIEDLKNLVLATAVIDKFSHISSDLVDMTDFWLRSVHCGVMTKLLAKESAVLHCERLFLTGLLHDLGSLIIYYKLPKASQKILLTSNHKRHLIAGLEQEIIGFTHADVAAALLKSWGLPESLYEAIGCYLNPEASQIHKLDAYLLSLASQLINLPHPDNSIDRILANLPAEALAMIHLDETQVKNITETAATEFTQVFKLMAPDKTFH